MPGSLPEFVRDGKAMAGCVPMRIHIQNPLNDRLSAVTCQPAALAALSSATPCSWYAHPPATAAATSRTPTARPQGQRRRSFLAVIGEGFAVHCCAGCGSVSYATAPATRVVEFVMPGSLPSPADVVLTRR